jgi:GTP diphosphokinase / guanosine-3',5'-bis(diphosphate) 3'-diphosphatase
LNPPNELVEGLPPDEAARVLRAFEIAVEAHQGQTRRDGSPYVEHSVRVARIVCHEMGCTDPNTLCAALLHDTLEDTQLPSFAIALDFTEAVVEIVEILTKDRSAPREDYYRRFETASESARQIKIADRLDNLRDLESFTVRKRDRYVKDTVEFFLLIAQEVNPQLAAEMRMHCGVE